MNYYPNQNYLQSNPMYSSSIPTLNGKLVDGVDIVKTIDVPIGSYGIYPKADFTELYVKTWLPDATTKIITYKPYFDTSKPDIDTSKANIDNSEVILNAIANLEKKLDALKNKKESVVKS